MMKNDDVKLLKGFASRQMDGLMDICECRVAFATEKFKMNFTYHIIGKRFSVNGR